MHLRMQLKMISDGAVEQEGASGDAKHHFGESIHSNTQYLLERLVNPKGAEKFAISRLHRNHHKCLLNVRSDGDLMYSEANQDVEDSLVEFWSVMETVIQ